MDASDRSFLLFSERVFSSIIFYLLVHCFGINTKTSFITQTTGYSCSISDIATEITTISDIVTNILCICIEIH